MCINSFKGSSYSSEKYQYKIEHIRSRNPDKLNFCLQYIARISKFEWGYSLASITYELFTVIFRENHVAFSVETNFAFGTLKEIHTKFAVFFFANITQTWNPRIVSIFDTWWHLMVFVERGFPGWFRNGSVEKVYDRCWLHHLMISITTRIFWSNESHSFISAFHHF